MNQRTKILIVGGGGHAAVILDMLSISKEYHVVGIVDSQTSMSSRLAVPVLGGDDQLPLLFSQGVQHAFIAIGDNQRRKQMAARLTSLGFQFINVLSAHAYISPSVKLGSGVCVMAGAVIQPFSTLDDHVIVNTGATVDHDCRLNAFAHVAPGVALTGHVRLGEGCFIGAGATVIPNTEVGDWVQAAAGCVISKNISAQQKVKGIPAVVY
jgi:UDP-perosamine 4-acetyltransferase